MSLRAEALLGAADLGAARVDQLLTEVFPSAKALAVSASEVARRCFFQGAAFPLPWRCFSSHSISLPPRPAAAFGAVPLLRVAKWSWPYPTAGT